jgi:ribosomal protein S18 acetylase RimI-like enzyme
MRSTLRIAYTVHDDLPSVETKIVDQGIGEANDLAAPLYEVQPLSCFARSSSGEIIGGAVGRTWGACCELQQLWVHAEWRRRGVGTRLIRDFEAHAQTRGCTAFYLETFNFQAPQLYRSLGYEIAHEHAVYPHGIVKYLMVRSVK